MNKIEIIGYVGAFLSAVTFIPQVWRAWKTKSTEDLSAPMLLIVLASTFVWLTYAVLTQSGPVIAANIIVLILSLTLLYFKYTFRKRET